MCSTCHSLVQAASAGPGIFRSGESSHDPTYQLTIRTKSCVAIRGADHLKKKEAIVKTVTAVRDELDEGEKPREHGWRRVMMNTWTFGYSEKSLELNQHLSIGIHVKGPRSLGIWVTPLCGICPDPLLGYFTPWAYLWSECAHSCREMFGVSNFRGLTEVLLCSYSVAYAGTNCCPCTWLPKC